MNNDARTLLPRVGQFFSRQDFVSHVDAQDILDGIVEQLTP